MKTQALIAGGTTGIGKANAELLLKDGIEVIIIGRPHKNLTSAVQELSKYGAVIGEALNLLDHKAVQQFSEQIERFSPELFLEHTLEDYDRYHDFNRAFFWITQSVAQQLKKNGGGSIVNIGSMWAKQAIKATPFSAYSMAKAGLHPFTQHLAMELATFNIRVNAVSPAVVVTPIYVSFIEKDNIKATLQGFNDFHPIGRVGQPQDVAKTIRFLLEDSSSWATGAIGISMVE